MESPEDLLPSKVISLLFWGHPWPDETCWRMGRKAEIFVGCNKFNISTTTYWFQTITLELEIYTPVDSFQLFDQCNLTNIDPNMTILASMIVSQFRGIILVLQEKCSNSTTTNPFQSIRLTLARSTPVDALRVVDYQNPTSIGKDTVICASGNIAQVQHVILFVATNLITLQQLVHFKLPDQHCKIQILKMPFEYLIGQIQKIFMEIQQFMSTSVRQRFAPSSLFVITKVRTQQLLNRSNPQ
jgi:hypothetical protein